jgi:hypothetical protein
MMQREYLWTRHAWESWMQARDAKVIMEKDPLIVPNQALFWIKQKSDEAERLGMSVVLDLQPNGSESARVFLDWPAQSSVLQNLASYVHESMLRAGACEVRR